MNAPSLLADIGGTNTRVALARGGKVIHSSVRHYPNAEFDALAPVLQRYIAETGTQAPAAACLAMAGPVRDGVGTLTNLDWTLDAATLAHATGAGTVTLLNDLQAQGHALGHLAQEALYPVIAGPPPRPEATRLVVGIGTGFNAAPVYTTPGGRFVPPSECGHVTLPVRNEDDLRLCHFLEQAHGFASVEDALSGRGLVALHRFVCERAGHPEQAILKGKQVMAALDEGNPLCLETARLFARLLGAVIGDMALTHLPFGGIFLIGGVSRAIAPWLAQMGFIEVLRDKGRFSDFLEQFSVTVVSDDDAALTGMALHLHALLEMT
ncbi:MAG: glucokinase [Tropicimonas sp.]|uniref:glucokinase n=1 Tax=Tropicimonas sp. TaxID=2067044 RepID=UPI003A858F9E